MTLATVLILPATATTAASFTDARPGSGTMEAASLSEVTPSVRPADVGNTVSWTPAIDQRWARDAGVTGGVTYSVERALDGRPAQPLGTTTGVEMTDPGLQPFGMVSAGAGHAVGITADGTMRGWGDSRSGTAGATSPLPASVPLPLDVSIVNVSAGGAHSLAVGSDGSLWEWGASAPSLVESFLIKGLSIAQASRGSAHSLAVASDGSVWAWGDNFRGELGIGGTDSRSTPQRVQALDGIPIAQVSAGGGHSLALASDGSVWEWGAGDSDQFGTGDRTLPRRVDALANLSITQVSAGQSHSLAVTRDGAVWAWGSNASGRLGIGDGGDSAVPMPVEALSGVLVAQVDAGDRHSLALSADGAVWAWGAGISGQLGLGDEGDRSVPQRVDSADGVSFTQVSAGRDFSLAVATDGSVWAWGEGESGQLGNGATGDRLAPTLAGRPAFEQVSAGRDHSLAVATDGSVWAWGVGSSGELGNGVTSAFSDVPVRVTASWGDARVVQVSAGGGFSLAVTSEGAVWAWGYGGDGQLGTEGYASSPVPVPVRATWGVDARIGQVSAGDAHVLALTSSGAVWAWGSSNSGRLGQGMGVMPSPAVPAPVRAEWGDAVYVTQVSAGYAHSLAVTSLGEVWAWGNGGSGRLGNGRAGDQGYATPVRTVKQWPEGVTITQVSAGNQHSVALASDDSVWAWGWGDSGRLGNGGTAGSLVPTRVAKPWDGAYIDQVSAGDRHTLVRTSRGEVWAWGADDVGQLGDGKTSLPYESVPVRTATGLSIRQLDAGLWHSVAVSADATAWAWGYGDSGRLGNGGAADEFSPVSVSPLASVLSVANCAAPSTLVGRFCTFAGPVSYSVSYRYFDWLSPAASVQVVR